MFALSVRTAVAAAAMHGPARPGIPKSVALPRSNSAPCIPAITGGAHHVFEATAAQATADQPKSSPDVKGDVPEQQPFQSVLSLDDRSGGLDDRSGGLTAANITASQLDRQPCQHGGLHIVGSTSSVAAQSKLSVAAQSALDDRSGGSAVSQSSQQGLAANVGLPLQPVGLPFNNNGLLDELDDSDNDLETVSLSGASSLGGNTAGEETEDDIAKGKLGRIKARHGRMTKEQVRVVGYERPYHESHQPASHNKKTQVGNIGIMVGNWGERAKTSKDQRVVQDKQIQGNPAQIVILLEANEDCKELLEQEARKVMEDVLEEESLNELEEDGPRPQSRHLEKARVGNVAARQWFQHHAIMSTFPKGIQILMAARKNNCKGMKILYSKEWVDGLFKKDKKNKEAITRVMVCQFDWRQNLGHIGLVVKVMAVHMHYHTANMKFSNEVSNKWWDKLSDVIYEHQPRFLVGDFNMSLTQVIPRLTERGHKVDTCSWYPWIKTDVDESCRGYRLGMDSLGMFHIGGDVQCLLTWDWDSIGSILKKAAVGADVEFPHEPQWRPDVLDPFAGANTPGKMWHCYKNKKDEKEGDFTLGYKLEQLLQRSTSNGRLEQLKTEAHARHDYGYDALPAYIRLKEKSLDTREWLVDIAKRKMHNGAHKPLCVFLNNSSQRSEKAMKDRKERYPLNAARCARYGIPVSTRRRTAVAASGAGTTPWSYARSSRQPAFLRERPIVMEPADYGETWESWGASNRDWSDWSWSSWSWRDDDHSWRY